VSADLLDDAMKDQLGVEWDRFKKAFAQAGDIGVLKLDELRIVAERDRKGLPPAVSVAAVQGLVNLEKRGSRGQSFRGGEETKDPTQRLAAQARASEVRLHDADHSEVYSVLAYHAGRRLGLNDAQACVLGDAVAYLLTGWGQVRAEARYVDKVIYEFKKVAGSPPEGGFFWSDLHSLMSRNGFKVMVDTVQLVGTAAFR